MRPLPQSAALLMSLIAAGAAWPQAAAPPSLGVQTPAQAGGAGAACASARRAFAVILSAGTPGEPGLVQRNGKII